MLINNKDLPKSTTQMILTLLNQERAPTYLETTPGFINKQARTFFAVAWANNYDICTFSLLPEVFHCDCTCNTDNTNNHLLTFSCQTFTGKQIAVLQIWIPNQKRFLFPWVFKFVLTSILETRVFLWTRLVMVDGDPQQRGELRKAMQVLMSNAMDGSGRQHLVEQGWKTHGLCFTASKM
jgi:hypothetical protein